MDKPIEMVSMVSAKAQIENMKNGCSITQDQKEQAFVSILDRLEKGELTPSVALQEAKDVEKLAN